VDARNQIGRYRVVRLLGSGGMGEVFEAYDDRLQRPVAIKGLLRGRVGADRRERLRREALSAAALSHPAITHVYEIVTEGDTDWVVMEYVEGRSLADVVTTGPLAAEEVARIGLEVGEALAEAHRRGIIHRDIKTENVLLTPAGHVKVLDFGLAKWTGARAAADDRLTTEGLVVGTSRAMSPEQALGQQVDARSDIFSLGSMLYELAVAKPAFCGATAVETMHQVAAAAFRPLALAAPGLPEELAAVIERCLARERDERYPSADALVAELRRVAASVTGVTAAGPGLRPSRTLAKTRTGWRWAAGGVAALTAAAVAALWFGLLAPGKPLAVAVLPVVADGAKADLRLASAAVADAVASRLAQLDQVAVVAGPEVRAVATAGKRPTEIARELGVTELVAASLLPSETGRSARVVLERLDGTTGRVRWSEQLDVGTDDLMLLEDRISTALDDAYRGVPTSGPGPRHPQR
jgi:TolB-like protein/predicted Ser/Thr protein kinase